MEIKCMCLGPVQTNCYIYWDSNTLEGVIIDPGSNGRKILEFLTTKEINAKAILLTHSHYDHIGACKEIVDKLNIPIYIGEYEKDILTSTNVNININNRFDDDIYKLNIYDTFADGSEYKFSNTVLKIIHTPGHTKGSICFYDEVEKLMFSGDTLFFETVGRTDLPTGNLKDIINSTVNNLFLLPDEVVAYPGHMKSTTIGHERINNEILSYL